MTKKNLLFFLIFFKVFTQTPANIQYEILSGSLIVGNSPYIIQVAFNIETSQEITFIQMKFDSLSARMHLISAERNGESIWLLRSGERAANDKVLAWKYDDENKQLNLYPNTWQAPYRLVLDIQITPLQEGIISDNLRASVQINNSLLSCQPSGRGNVFSLTR